MKMKTGTPKLRWIIPVIITGGAVLRISHLFSIPFDTPFHLGGLFYEFSRQIILNHFALPETIPYYSLGGLPFNYPPLGFYLQALVMQLFSPAPFITVNLLPPLITAFSLPVFYWMVKAQTSNDGLIIAALFAYALMPAAFINQIEGAGLAEACGTLALLFLLGWLFRFERNPRPAPAILAGVFLGLSVLSSPGSAYGGAIIALLYFFKSVFQDLQRHNFRNSAWLILTGLISFLVSAPYWLAIIQRHELGGFSTAFLSQQDASALLNQVRYLITFKPADMITFVSDEGIFGFLFDWLIFAGLIWAILNKQVFQVVILLAVWLIPREGSWLVAIPAAWLAALGLVHLVLPLIQKAFSTLGTNKKPPLAPGLLALILILLIIGNALFALNDLQNQPELLINPEVLKTLNQGRQLIPADAHILVAGNGALREWAPALLEREVLNCEFGLEWQPEELKQVNLINDAIADNDLAGAMAVVRDYSGDTSLWLVGDPGQIEELVAGSDLSLEVSIQMSAPGLVLAILQIN
jgi:hypothetical protein